MQHKLYECPNIGQTSLGASLSSGYQVISHKTQIHRFLHSVCGSKMLKSNSKIHYWAERACFYSF